MDRELKDNVPAKVLMNICRILIGAVFVFSGVVKAVDPVGTQIKLTDYLAAFGMGGILLDSTLLILACLLAGFEILIGVYLLLGVFFRGTSLIAMIFMLLLTPFTLYTALENPVEDCGCFGDALILTNWQTFYKNIFLLLLAVYVFIRRRYAVPFVTPRRQWMVLVVTVLVSVRFMLNNIAGLPVLDFRPYRIGTDLRKEMACANPAMSDFSILDGQLTDVTSDILEDSSYVFLLSAPHLEDASEDYLDLIDDLYDYCDRYGYRMVGLTASGTDAIRRWTEDTGAEYRFLHCDEIPLQTMVRSNPGLVLLKDGTIVNKWSQANIPQDEVLSGPLDELEVGQMPPYDPMRTPWAVALIFLLPLLLVVAIDVLKETIP